jgi:hypothetical protein
MKVYIGDYTPEGPREASVRIDRWDTFNADCTLALIIAPLLSQYKKNMIGAAHVDDEDVPVEIRSTSAPPVPNEWTPDLYFFDRWNWVLDEMIFAFESKNQDEDVQDKYATRITNGFRLFGKYYTHLWE